MKPGHATRVGAAAFALGLSVAGPQIGTAAAEESAADSAAGSSVSDGTEGVGKSRPGRRDGSAVAERPAAIRPGTRAIPRPAAVTAPGRPADFSPADPPRITDRTSTGRRAPGVSVRERLSAPEVIARETARPASVANLPSLVSPAVGLLPSAATSVQGPVIVPAAVSAGCQTCRRAPRPSQEPVLQGVTALGAAVERMLDSVGKFLLTIPANPITDFLAGAVWLVRRTLFPVGADVGLFGSAACVQTKDCSGLDLTEADLSLLVLADVKFTNTILTKADLSNSNLATADMAGAILDGAILKGTRLTGTVLTGAILTGADLKAAKLDGADLTDADLRVRNLPTGPLTGIGTAKSLRGANLAGLNLAGVDLSGKDLTGAILTGADLTGVKLGGADLTDADLRVRNLPTGPQTGIGTAKSLRGAVLADQNLAGVDLSGKDLTGADFSSAVLTNVVLRDAILANAIFTDADLVGADFGGVSDADLVSATWEGADLSGQDFHDRDLAGINWTAVDLINAILTGVDLTGATLTDVDLTRADLRRATFTGVSDADLVSATWKGADLSGQAAFAGRNLAGIDWTDTILGSVNLSCTPDCRTDLTGAIFTGVSDSDLRSITWVGADLSTTNFSNRTLTGIVWRDTTLADAILTNTDLSEANLSRTNLTGADLSGARLGNAILVQTDFTTAILTGIPDSDLVSAQYFGTILAGQDFSGRNLAGIQWNLGTVNLTKAVLRGTVLDGADLKGADLTGADLFQAQNLRKVLNFGTATLVEAKLVEADLREVDLTNAKLSKADLFGANLDGAKLAGADLSGADLRGARIVPADGPGVGVSDADLRSADLSGAKLNGQDLSGRDLYSINLNKADLTGAKLIGTVLTSADLEGANLTQADLTRALLAYAKTTGVVWKDTTCPNGSTSSAGCSVPGLISADKLTVKEDQESQGDEPVMATILLQGTLGGPNPSITTIGTFTQLGQGIEKGHSVSIPNETGDLWIDKVRPLTLEDVLVPLSEKVVPIPVIATMTVLTDGDFSTAGIAKEFHDVFANYVDKALAPAFEQIQVKVDSDIDGFDITSSGSGYTSAPTVTIRGGNLPELGTDATATATVDATGRITGLEIKDRGSYYVSAPTVEFSGGGGSGAAATAKGDFVASTLPVTLERLMAAAQPGLLEVLVVAAERVKQWVSSGFDPDDPVGMGVTVLIPVDPTLMQMLEIAKVGPDKLGLDDQYLQLLTLDAVWPEAPEFLRGALIDLDVQLRWGLLVPPEYLPKNAGKDRSEWTPQSWEATYAGSYARDSWAEYVVETKAWPQIDWIP